MTKGHGCLQCLTCIHTNRQWSLLQQMWSCCHCLLSVNNNVYSWSGHCSEELNKFIYVMMKINEICDLLYRHTPMFSSIHTRTRQKILPPNQNLLSTEWHDWKTWTNTFIFIYSSLYPFPILAAVYILHFNSISDRLLLSVLFFSMVPSST